MLNELFCFVNLLLVFSSLLALRLPACDRTFTLSLLRSLLALPLLIIQYIHLGYDLAPDTARVVLLSEAQFGVMWGGMAYRLSRAMVCREREPKLVSFLELTIGCVLLGAAWHLASPNLLNGPPSPYLVVQHRGFAYFSSLLLLFTMFSMAWKLEFFWRNLAPLERWEYKFLVVSCILVCCTLSWASSYRLTYLRLYADHILLLGSILIIAWLMMLYSVVRHRLLNRKIFVSRTIVQASLAPAVLGIYLLGLGLVSLLVRLLGWSVHFVLFWILAVLGFVSVALYGCSATLRRRTHHFISTHFYVNKYEYRDEWLSLSHLLRGAITAQEIVKATSQVLSQSLYATRLLIWAGSEESGYSALYSSLEVAPPNPGLRFKGETPLVRWLKTRGVFYTGAPEDSAAWREVREVSEDLLSRGGVVLLSPILAGEQLLGVIGVGEEFAGGRYGDDDFDLLAAVGSQAASALLAARMGEELANMRRMQAIDHLSAFILHDLKNATSMLSLVRANASEHMNDPDFHVDMLDAIDHALKRMAKVESHLTVLKGQLEPDLVEVDLCECLNQQVEDLSRKLKGLAVLVECSQTIKIQADRSFVATILENLLMNSLQAAGEGTTVTIHVAGVSCGLVIIDVRDNGPGIPEHLLPDRLFEPFSSSRPRGSGIGLWQVRKMISVLGWEIAAENLDVGARFLISIPHASEGQL